MSVIAPVSRVTAAFVDQLNANFDYLDDRVEAFISIEAFGAVGDGVTDDSAAFLAAVNDGKAIMLTGGKTYVMRNITIPADSTFPGACGVGGEARIVAPADAISSDYFFRIQKTSDVFFRDIFFDMPANTDPTGGANFSRALQFIPAGLRGSNYRVEGCRFAGAASAFTGTGYIVENSRFAGNYLTGQYGDAISFNCLINSEIVDNVLEETGLASTGALAGAIRVGTNDQLDMHLNVTIARNVLTSCCLAAPQSAIDCFSGAGRNFRITDNILNLNGTGIELKTMIWTEPVPLPLGAEDVYEDNVIANNTIRMFDDRSTSAITAFHSTAGSAKGKAANLRIFGNSISAASPITPGAFSHYAISVAGFDNVTIDSNDIFNVGHGIAVGGLGPVSDTSDNIFISGNKIDCSEIAVQHAGGTLNGLYIRNNPLLRVSVGTGATVGITNTCTDLEISGNHIESVDNTALDIRAVAGGRIFDNTLIADAACVATSGTASSNLRFRDNECVAATGPAFNLATGTGIEIWNNDIDVPIGSRTVSGAATYTAAGNIRGMSAADPDPAAGGSLGDIFLDSTAATAGWRCTTAGAAGAAAYTVI